LNKRAIDTRAACGEKFTRRLYDFACESRDSRASLSRPRENWHVGSEGEATAASGQRRRARSRFYPSSARTARQRFARYRPIVSDPIPQRRGARTASTASRRRRLKPTLIKIIALRDGERPPTRPSLRMYALKLRLIGNLTLNFISIPTRRVRDGSLLPETRPVFSRIGKLRVFAISLIPRRDQDADGRSTTLARARARNRSDHPTILIFSPSVDPRVDAN